MQSLRMKYRGVNLTFNLKQLQVEQALGKSTDIWLPEHVKSEARKKLISTRSVVL